MEHTTLERVCEVIKTQLQIAKYIALSAASWN